MWQLILKHINKATVCNILPGVELLYTNTQYMYFNCQFMFQLLAGKAVPHCQSTPTDAETDQLKIETDHVMLTENVSTQYPQPPAATPLKNTASRVKTPATPTLSSPRCGTLSSPSSLLESPYRFEIVMPPKLPIAFGKVTIMS
jgi:hypothetical protein